METIGEINKSEEFIMEWSIKDFFSLPFEEGVSYFSPLFSFGVASWCIEISQNGENGTESNGKMCFYLHRKSLGPPISFNFSFGLKNAYGFHFTHSLFLNDTERHGHESIINRELLLKWKSERRLSDTLTWLCRIKSTQKNFESNLPLTISESKRFRSKTSSSGSKTTTGEIHERKDLVCEWLIREISSIFSEEDVTYSSPLFSDYNASWCLEFHLKATGSWCLEFHLKANGIIWMYLYRKSPGPPIRMEYSFGIQYGNAEYNEHFTCSVFNDTERFGQHLTFSKEELLRYKSLYLPSDTLTLILRIRHSQYEESSSKEMASKSIKILQEYKVFQDFKQLFLDQEDCDVIIKVKGQEFKAHRTILAARSSVFRSTFRHNMKEKETGIVDIEDCDPSSFSDFLSFLYCGDIEAFSGENVFSLFATADKYDVQDLRKICLDYLKENISPDTFCYTLTLALQHSERELITIATDFFVKNSMKIVKTVEWQSFLANYPTQSNELIIKMLEATTGPNK